MRAWISEKITDWRIYLFLACVLPAAMLGWAIAANDLGANPLETIRDATGIWTLRFLLFTLAITPLRRITRWQSVIKARRMLGLFAFFYGALHFISYVWLDQFFAVAGIGVDRYSSSRAVDVGAGVEQHRRAFDVAAGRIRSVTDQVKQRLMLPVHQIRIHAALEQRAKHAGVVQR